MLRRKRKNFKHSLVFYGNEVLASKTEKVNKVTPEIEELVEEMFEIMYIEDGIGLAAPQIGLGISLICIDISCYKNGPKIALLNPKIVRQSSRLVAYEEGCLSLPGISEEVMRPDSVVVEALNMEGRKVKIKADNLYARVLQHEIDHLSGIVFTDRLEPEVQKKYQKKLEKIKKKNKE